MSSILQFQPEAKTLTLKLYFKNIRAFWLVSFSWWSTIQCKILPLSLSDEHLSKQNFENFSFQYNPWEVKAAQTKSWEYNFEWPSISLDYFTPNLDLKYTTLWDAILEMRFQYFSDCPTITHVSRPNIHKFYFKHFPTEL